MAHNKCSSQSAVRRAMSSPSSEGAVSFCNSWGCTCQGTGAYSHDPECDWWLQLDLFRWELGLPALLRPQAGRWVSEIGGDGWDR